jgi:hypothetical protein
MPICSMAGPSHSCGVDRVVFVGRPYATAVQGLQGAADLDGDGIVSLNEIYTYVEREVSRKSRAVGGSQHPVMKGELEGTLPLIRLR